MLAVDTSKGAAEVADAAAMAPDTWVVVTAPEASLQEARDELAEEIRFAVRDVDDGGVCTLMHAPDAAGGFVDDLASSPLGIVLLTGLEGVDDDAIRLLDLQRNRLVGVASFVILTTDAGAERLAGLAPNLWSLVGPKAFRLDRSVGRMDVEARLASMRDETGLDDDEVVRQAEAGNLPADPMYAEWLALLGRGDLLGGA
jgi:hypothetical protein